MKKIYTIIIAFLFIQNLGAQNMFNLNETKNITYLRYGIEPTIVFAVGHMHVFNINGINRNLAVLGEFSRPQKSFGNNYELKTGGIMPVVQLRDWGFTFQLNFSTGHVETKNFESQKIAFDYALNLGLYKEKWYLSLVGEYENIMANKITNSQYYRDYAYPEAKDGWYKGAGGNVQFGLETGFTIKQRFDVNFDLKVPFSEKFNSYNGSPAHTNVTLGYRF